MYLAGVLGACGAVQGPVGMATLLRLQEDIGPKLGGSGHSRGMDWSRGWAQGQLAGGQLGLGPASCLFVGGILSVQITIQLQPLLPGVGTHRSSQRGRLHLERKGERH